jgi:hypothetical protein
MWAHSGDTPASVSQMLELQVCTTMPSTSCLISLLVCHLSSTVWDLEAVSFFSSLILKMSGLFLLSFTSAYKLIHSFLSSSPSNKNQHTLLLVCFLDASFRATSLRDLMADEFHTAYHEPHLSSCLPPHSVHSLPGH